MSLYYRRLFCLRQLTNINNDIDELEKEYIRNKILNKDKDDSLNNKLNDNYKKYKELFNTCYEYIKE